MSEATRLKLASDTGSLTENVVKTFGTNRHQQTPMSVMVTPRTDHNNKSRQDEHIADACCGKSKSKLETLMKRF